MVDYQVGDVFLRRSPNLLGWAIRTVTRSTVNHAGIVIAVDQGKPIIIEALWRGAIVRPFKSKYCTFYRPNLSVEQVSGILPNALMVGGIRYGYLDVVALGMAQSKKLSRFFSKWLATRITDPTRLFCSQTVDMILTESGFHTFNDGRMSQDVTPGDILQVAEKSWTLLDDSEGLLE